jgi:hypothetical protein
MIVVFTKISTESWHAIRKGESMKFRIGILTALSLLLLASSVAMAQSAPQGKTTILKAADINAALFPERVFFRGKVAPTQMRNTGGVHFADGLYFLAGLVDNSGYSTAVKEKYQGYLITEVPLEIAGQHVTPGAYGFGFLEGGKFVLQDLGAHDVFQVDAHHDADMKRPMPLQVIAGSAAGTYLLYHGRDTIEIKRAE